MGELEGAHPPRLKWGCSRGDPPSIPCRTHPITAGWGARGGTPRIKIGQKDQKESQKSTPEPAKQKGRGGEAPFFLLGRLWYARLSCQRKALIKIDKRRSKIVKREVRRAHQSRPEKRRGWLSPLLFSGRLWSALPSLLTIFGSFVRFLLQFTKK